MLPHSPVGYAQDLYAEPTVGGGPMDSYGLGLDYRPASVIHRSEYRADRPYLSALREARRGTDAAF